MKITRFNFRLKVSAGGDSIDYEHDGTNIKTPEDIRRIAEEAIRICFPEAA